MGVTDSPGPPFDDIPGRLLQLFTGFVVTQALHSAVTLEVPDLVADGPVSVDDLAKRSGAHPDALHRLLRTLAAHGVFAEVAPAQFGPTALSRALETDTPGSMRPYILYLGEMTYAAFRELEHSVRTGEPAFERVFGASLFDYMRARPDEGAKFDAAMAATSTGRVAGLFDRDWSDAGTIVDVGGGNGTILREVLTRQPHLRGAVFDLPNAVDGAEALLQAGELSDRWTCIPGDFFEDVPSGFDVYLLSQILHDWDDERATVILRNCRAAIPPHGRLIILEQVLPPGDAPHPGKILDLLMLVLTDGGRERSEPQWHTLLGSAGFAIERVAPSGRSGIIECRPE
jgi:O-methyltransferase domain/Dimerisation domain